MKSTIVRKVTTLGVGLSLLAAGSLATVGPASAATCYVVIEGDIVSYTCIDPNNPPPPEDPPPPPPPGPTPPVVVVPPTRVPSKLGLLTKAGTVSGPATVTVAAQLTDLRGRPRKSTPVNLCWRAVTASRESCVARTTNSVGVVSVAVKVSTATTVRAVANATATTGASRSARVVVRVRPKVAVVAGVRSLTLSINPASRVKVTLQKKAGTRYVNVRAAYTSTRGTARFTKLTKRAYYRVYVYASGGRNAVYSGAARVR